MSRSREDFGSARQHRGVVLLGLVALTLASWIGTVGLARSHAGHGSPAVFSLVLMWVVMMAAMMVPVAAPSLLAVAGAGRDRRGRSDPIARSALFLSGDLLVWIAFSLLAAFAQWRLHEAALMSPDMASSSSVLSGVLLVAIGLFQFTSIKERCLRRCRALPDPAPDVPEDRPRGAFRLGLEHGAFSAGSCGALMLVLFATGVMSVPWMAALTALLVLERIVPAGLWVGRTAGVLLVAWGGWLLFATRA